MVSQSYYEQLKMFSYAVSDKLQDGATKCHYSCQEPAFFPDSHPNLNIRPDMLILNMWFHRIQRRPRPIHNNAKCGAHLSSPLLGLNMAWGGGKKFKFVSKELLSQK